MTNIMKKWLAVAGCLAGLMFPRLAMAGAAEDYRVAKDSSRFYWLYTSSSASRAMRLWYTGSSTEAVVYISSTLIQAQAPYGTNDTANFGTANGAYNLSAAAYDTFGELCDAINVSTSGVYHCRLLGAKRDDNTLLLRDQAAASATNSLTASGGGFDVRFDTGPSAGGGNTTGTYLLRLGFQPEKGKRILLKKCVWKILGTDNFNVYGKSSRDERTIEAPPFKSATVDDTTVQFSSAVVTQADGSLDFTVNSADGGGDGWAFAKDAHVVVEGGANASLQAAANYMACLVEER